MCEKWGRRRRCEFSSRHPDRTLLPSRIPSRRGLNLSSFEFGVQISVNLTTPDAELEDYNWRGLVSDKKFRSKIALIKNPKINLFLVTGLAVHFAWKNGLLLLSLDGVENINNLLSPSLPPLGLLSPLRRDLSCSIGTLRAAKSSNYDAGRWSGDDASLMLGLELFSRGELNPKATSPTPPEIFSLKKFSRRHSGLSGEVGLPHWDPAFFSSRCVFTACISSRHIASPLKWRDNEKFPKCWVHSVALKKAPNPLSNKLWQKILRSKLKRSIHPLFFDVRFALNLPL